MKKGLKVVQLLLKIVFIVLLIKLTTFGWRTTKSFNVKPSAPEELTAQNMKDMVEYLAGKIGNRNYAEYAGLNRAAEYIRQQFEQLGYSVTMMPYPLGDQVYNNIVAQDASGKEFPETIIIGAHYDSCFNPGADDNASGVAGLIELARLLKNSGLKAHLKFIAFVNEEPPFFLTENMGSRVYAKAAKQKGEKIKAAIILEMLGYYSQKKFSQRYLPLVGPFYPNRADFIALVGNFPSGGIVKKLAAYFKASSEFPVEYLIAPDFIPGIYWSDHWSFWKEGYPALMVTDTAYLRNPHYHRQTDLGPTLDYARTAAMLHGLKEAIIQFANKN